MTREFFKVSAVVVLCCALVSFLWSPFWWSFVLVGPLFLLGVVDTLQTKRTIRRNFPVIGNLRYLMEMVRPEIGQYFIESDLDGMPFNREFRSIAYQRAKRVRSTTPFGTQRDLYKVGAEWLQHSLAASTPVGDPPRVTIGRPGTQRPYEAALFNISAMSYGSLSSRAIEALSRGAADGGFFHNTGEGGISEFHLAGGADLVWQVGTGYFGCRTSDGGFDLEKFGHEARRDAVRMIEIKLSQGAKPGHGGILPAAKITPEIARIRGVGLGRDIISPPAHSAFQGPRGLLEWVTELREESGGKPVGFKLCVGDPVEFLSIVRAMQETGLGPDFITVDGAEGGTGAAPLEFSNSMGWPLNEGLDFVHNALLGFGLRGSVKLIAAGKIITAFHMAQRFALGADLCNSARGMMFALGCIQARRCHSNDCPAGVATQDPGLVRGLVLESKVPRVTSFQERTVHALFGLLGAAGLENPGQLTRRHIIRRVSQTESQSYEEIYPELESGCFIGAHVPDAWRALLERTNTEAFGVHSEPATVKIATTG